MPDPKKKEAPSVNVETDPHETPSFEETLRRSSGNKNSMVSDAADSYNTYESRAGDPFVDTLNEYDKGLVEGLDQNHVRADNQGIISEYINHFKTAPFKIALGVLGTAGNILDMENWAGALSNYNTDYTNWLTKLTDKGKQFLDDSAPIYQHNPDKLFDPTDSAWWIKNIGGVINSATEFGITGFGLGGAIGKTANALKYFNMVKAANGLTKTSQLLNAIGLTQAEGVMTGADVYKQVLDKTGDENKAADAASTSVRLNFLNVALNYTSLTPIMRSVGSTRQVIGEQLKREVGESLVDYTKRTAGNFIKNSNTLKAMGYEVPQEALEEGVNVIAQNEGLSQGGIEKNDGSKEDTFFERAGKSLLSEEGLVSMGLGAVGGAGNTVVMAGVAKIMGKNKEQEQTYQAQRQTLIKTFGEFEGAKLADKIEKRTKLTNELQRAALTNDAVKMKTAQDDLFFDQMNESFNSGTTEGLEQSLKSIQDLKPEEAVAQGFAKSTSDMSYKQYATERLQQLKENEALYNQVKGEFNNVKVPEDINSNDAVKYTSKIQDAIFHNQFRMNELSKFIKQEQAKQAAYELNNPDSKTNLQLKYVNSNLVALEKEKAALESSYKDLINPKKQSDMIQSMSDVEQKAKEILVKKEQEEADKIETERKVKSIKESEVKAKQAAQAKQVAKTTTKGKTKVEKKTIIPGEFVDVIENDQETHNNVEVLSTAGSLAIIKDKEGNEITVPINQIHRTNINQQVVDANKVKPKRVDGDVADLNDQVIDLNNVVKDSIERPVDVAVDDDISTDVTGRPVSIGAKKFEALTFAYLSNEYEKNVTGGIEEKIDKLGEDGKVIQNKDLDQRLLSPEFFQPGTKIGIFIDINNKDYLINKDDFESVPIGIKILGENKVSAYIHKLDWINANNIAPGKDGSNIAIQREKLREFRRLVFNASKPIETNVTYKSLGSLNSTEEFKPVTEVLGDNFQILVGHDGYQNTNFNKELVNKQSAVQGAVYIAIPTPVQDKWLALFPKVSKLNQEQGNVILSTIELFDKAQNNELTEDEVTDLDKLALEGIQLDLRIQQDVKALLDSITYNGYGTVGIDKNQAKTFFVDFKGRRLIFGVEKGSQYSFDDIQTHRDEILAKLQNKYVSVSLNELNLNKENYYFPTFENGKIVSKQAKDYKTYVASKLSVDFHGQFRYNEDGSIAEVTYFSQPVIGINSDIEPSTELAKAEVSLVGSDFIDTKAPITGENNTDVLDEEGYLINEEDANPNFDKFQTGYSSLNDLFVDKEVFNIYQQYDITNTIVNGILQKIQNNPNISKNQAFGEITTEFKNLYNKFKYYSEIVPGSTEDEKKAKGVFKDLASNQKRAFKLNLVLEHMAKFEQFANYKLKTLGVTFNEEGEFDLMSADASSDSYDDSRSFSTSSKEQASTEIRSLFNFIPELELKNGKYEYKRNFLGFSTFLPFDVVWDDTMRVVNGSSSLDEMLATLEGAGAIKPEFKSIADKIRNSSIKLQNEFFSTFSKQHVHFVTLLRTSGETGAVLKPIETNRSNAERIIEAEWLEGLKRSEIVSYSAEGDLIIDTVKANEIYNEYKTWFAKKDFSLESLTVLSNILNKVGVDISPEALDYARKHPKYINRKVKVADFETLINGQSVGVIKLLFDRLTKGEKSTSTDQSLFELNNPFVTESSSINALASLELKFRKSLFLSSFKDGEGKTIYSFVNNTYLSHQMNRLTRDEASGVSALLNTAYASTSSWLKNLLSNKSFQDVFGMSYIDTIKQMYNPSANGVKLARMSRREFEITRIGLFQNQGKKASKFLYLTPSDKTTMPVITAIKQVIGFIKGKDNNLKFNQDTTDALYAIVESEIKRIQQTKTQLADTTFDKKQYIDEYHNGIKAGLKFHWFPFLNNMDEIMTGEGTERTLKDLTETDINLIKNKLTDYINELIKKKLDAWKKMEIVQSKDGQMDFTHFDKTYLAKVKGNNDNDRLTYVAADFVINNLIANANITQIFSGDPALHGKKSSRGKNVTETLINFSKRNAKDIAPGLDGNFKDTHFKTVYLSDLKGITIDHYDSYIDHLTKLIGKHEAEKLMQAYEDINATDAQEWTTVTEHLDVMEAFGRIAKDERELLEKALTEGNATETQLKYVLQPMKPVYVEQIIENGIAKMVYIKTSSFPLLPQLTKGQDLDKLRIAMEVSGVQRAVVKSGVKLGSQNVQEFDFDNFNFTDNFIQLPRSGFRIQQEVPYDAGKDHIGEVTQARKLIVSEMPDSMQFTIPQDATLLPSNTEGDNTISGKELKHQFEKLHIELIQRGFNSLLNRIGGEHKEDGTLRIDDFNKLKKILVEEAQERGYPINDILALNLVDGKFELPLWASPNASKFEALLNSLITNSVIKLKLPGKSYVQGSPAGLKNVKTDSKLQFIRPDGKGGILPAECMIAWPFKGLDMNKYVNEDSTPNKEFPSELLEIIGNRIPNQGLNSMLPMKIVKFLPEAQGDLMIVPDAVAVQMGSDYDVDKIYAYISNIEFDANNNLVKASVEEGSSLEKASKQAIENAIIDIHKMILKHPDNLARVMEPLGFGPLNAVAKEVDRILNANQEQDSYLYDGEQSDIFFSNVGGKAGTGVGSLASTNHALAIEAQLYIKVDLNNKEEIEVGKGFISNNNSIRFKDSKGEIITDHDDQVPTRKGAWKLGSIKGFGKDGTRSGKLISQVISYIQSAAVDNAKEQILSKLNLNMTTFGVGFVIARTGFDERYIGNFLSQEILREYVAEVASLGDSINQASAFGAKTQATEKLIKKYELAAGHDYKAPDGESNSFSLEELKSMIKESVSETKTAEYYKNQIEILKAFQEMDLIASDLRTIASAINAETAGVGKSLAEAGDKQTRIMTLLENSGTINIGNVDKLFHGTIVGEMSMYGPIAAVGLYSDLFPYSSPAFTQARLSIEGEIDRQLTVDELAELYKEIKSYIFTNKDLGLSSDVVSDRTRLFFGNDTEKSLGERIAAYKKTPEGSKNFFLSRILTEKPAKKGDPYLVKYQSSPENRSTEDIMSTSSLLEMLESKNEIEKAIANDLILYNYLSYNESAKAISFSNFIPVEYLNKIKFSDKLRALPFNDSDLLYQFTKQWFQHSPYKAKKLKPDLSEMRDKTGKGTIPDTFTLLPIGSKNAAMNLLVAPAQDKKFKRYPFYLSLFDEIAKKTAIYEFKGYKDNKPLYARISSLGQFGFKEYTFGAYNQQTAIQKNKIVEVLPQLDKVPQVKTLEANVTTPVKEEIEQLYGFKEGGVEEIKTVLNSIEQTSNNPYFVQLSKVLSKHTDQLKDWTLTETKDTTVGGKADSTAKNIKMNLETARDAAKFEETFLHELIHAMTVSKLNDVTNPVVQSIKALHIKYKNSVNQKELAKWTQMFHDFKAGREVDQQWLADNKHIYYPAYNDREFVTMLMTDQKTQLRMSGERFDSKQSILDRFIKLITDLLAGANPKTDIEHAFKHILDLVAETSSEVDVNSSQDSSPNLDENSPIVKRIKTSELISQRHGMLFVKKYADRQKLNNLLKELRESFPGAAVLKTARNFGGGGRNIEYISVNGSGQTSLDLSPNFKSTTKTGVDSIDEYVKRWTAQIDKLKSQKVKGDADRNAEIDRRILYLEQVVKTAKDDKSISHIIATAEEQLEWVEKNLEGEINPENFKILHSYVSIYEDISQILNIEGNKKLLELSGFARQLRKELRDKENDYLQTLALETLGQKIDKAKLLEGAEDTGIIAANLLDASNSRIPMVRFVSELLNKSTHLVNKHLTEFETELAKQLDELIAYQKSKGVSSKDIYDFMLQRNSDGTLTGNLVNRYTQAYYDEIKKRKSTGKTYWTWVNANSNFNITPELEAQYEKDKAAAREQYEEEYSEDAATVERKMEEWAAIFSPYIYVENIKSGKGYLNKGQKGKKYIEVVPKDKWIDPQYLTIMQEEKLKTFYEYYRHEIKEAMNSLPENETQANYLPEVQKSLLEELRANGTTGLLKGLKKSAIEAITTELEPSISYEDKDPITGQVIPKIPTYMVTDKLGTDEKSYDLGKVLQMFKAMSLNYEHKSAVEDKVLLAQRALKEMAEYKTYTNELGEIEYQRDKNGDLIAQQGGHRNTTTQVDSVINSMLYGKRRDVEGKAPIKVGGKQLTGSKVADVLFNLTQLKGMGFNIFSPITNLLYGTVSNIIHASGRQEFTGEQVMKAMGMMLQTVGNGAITSPMSKKITALMEHFDVLFEVNEMKYGNKSSNKGKKGISSLSPYELQKRSEYFVQGQTMIATLLNTKLVNGKNLWDALNVAEDGSISWNPEFGENLLYGDYEYKLKAKIQQVNKKIHGNYDPNSPIALKRKWWGRALLQFRSWLPEAAAARVRKTYYDERLGREVKGRWLSYGDIFNEGGILGIIKTLVSESARQDMLKDGNISEQDVANMRKNFTELAFMASILMLGLVVKGLDDDDDDTAVFNFLVNQLTRVEADLHFFNSPGAMQKILKQPVPVMKTLGDISDIFPAAVNVIMGNDTYKSGRRKGRSKFMKELKEAFPLLNQPDKIEGFLSEAYD